MTDPDRSAPGDPLAEDVVCVHGTAMDLHCCNCHSGFLFDIEACVCVFTMEVSDMDMRNGDMYPDLVTALEAGVPAEHLAEVEIEIVRVKNGPFKGRVYQRNPQTRQLERRTDLEPNRQEA